jgi:predicted RNase H-like HicB family nuclease
MEMLSARYCMIYDVLVTQEANERYTARVLALPDIVVSGTDEQEVLHQVQAAIAHLLNKSRLVRLTLPRPTDREADPWVRAAGMWANDPDWEQFQQAIHAYRQKIETSTDSPQ